jgi:hypothetical protein
MVAHVRGEAKPPMANVLPMSKRAEVIAHLCEGAGIRATSRLTDVSKPAILSLLLKVGTGCDRIADRLVRNLDIRDIQCDEIWSYVQKKQSRVQPGDPPEFGDAYTYLALARTQKLIVSYRVGKRDAANAEAFIADLRARLVSVPQISLDGFAPYPVAVGQSFEACPTAVMVPMYMYEHGGFCLATKPFADPWDSGQVGIVWASDPGYTEETLCAIVEAASALAQGLVYGWVVKGPGGAHVDSCWGYIEPKGFDESSYVLQDAREHVSALIEEDTLHGWPAGQIHSLYTEHPVLNVAMMQKIQKNAL